MTPPVASLATLPTDLAKQVVVVHGRHDEIVPVTHSQALVANAASTLILVDDDHRLSATATGENLASWIVRATGAHLS